MQKHDRWLEEDEDRRESRPSSRRNSASLSRRGSLNKETEAKKMSGSSSSCNSTPKRIHKQQNNFDFVVTGKQVSSSRGDRANSLPGPYHRRSSADLKSKRSLDSARKTVSPTPKSRQNSLEDDVSLDLSQVSDFEDLSSKYGLRSNLSSLATGKKPQKPRSSSAQSMPQKEPKRLLKTDKRSRDSNNSRDSRDSFHKASSLTYRHAMSTELDYSSMSPEYSASSADSVAGVAPDTLVTPSSRDQNDYSCVSTWQDCSEENREGGEWSHFWANYNNSLARVPVHRYYDQCPTPYRTEDIELPDIEFSTASSKKRSPENLSTINNIIRNEGLKLTPRETQNIIKCAHILGNVLSKAIERQATRTTPEKIQIFDPETQTRKKSMTLNLKETVIPLEVKEEKRWESVPTQTDISLPNTKSAPKIFENILRQLSKSSLEEVAQREEKKEDSNEK